MGALLGSVHYGEFGLPEPVAILDTVLVDPLFSRRGVASAMFRQLLRNAKALKVECLRTELGYEEQQLAHTDVLFQGSIGALVVSAVSG